MEHIREIEEFLLLEGSYFNIRKEMILTNSYIKSIMSEDYLEEYAYNLGLDINNYDRDELFDTIGFKEYVYDRLSNNFEDAMMNIFDSIDRITGLITIYRAMTVGSNYISEIKKHGKRLGIYWSWSENGAETHWGDYSKKSVVVIVSQIHEKYVNWKETIELNINESLGDEKEIRLYKNTPLTIIGMYLDDEEVDLEELSNIRFTS